MTVIGYNPTYMIENVTLKFDRVTTMKMLKDEFGMGLHETKHFLDFTEQNGYIDMEGAGFSRDADTWLKIFNGTPPHIISNENIREPDTATAEALAWLNGLSDLDKERIKLIGDWEHPACFAAAIC